MKNKNTQEGTQENKQKTHMDSCDYVLKMMRASSYSTCWLYTKIVR